MSKFPLKAPSGGPPAVEKAGGPQAKGARPQQEGGVLLSGSGGGGQQGAHTQALSQAEAHAQETQRTLDAVEDAGDGLSQSLRQSIERLTQEAKADIPRGVAHLPSVARERVEKLLDRL